MTWLIHHGHSPFDYKRRGLVINCWIQLPGRSFDTRSQSICTATPPYPQGFAPVYPYNSHTLIHPPTRAPNTLSCTLASYPAPSSQLPSHALPFTLPSLSQLCIPYTPLTSALSQPQPTSPAARPYILFLHLCTPLCPVSSCSDNLSFLCIPELQSHQRFTVLTLSPLSFATSYTPPSYTASFVFFIYSRNDANSFIQSVYFLCVKMSSFTVLQHLLVNSW